MTLNRKTNNIKVVDLRKLLNFVVDKFSIWNVLEPLKMIYTPCSIIWVEWLPDMDAYECMVQWKRRLHARVEVAGSTARSPAPENGVSRCWWRHNPHLKMHFQVQAFYPLLEIVISKSDNFERVSCLHLKMPIRPLLQTFCLVVSVVRC
jgi:hypothetical protein